MGKLDGKKVLMLIANKDFRDEEYEAPRKILEGEGAKVTVASSSLNNARGMLGKSVKPDILLKDARAADYDAVVFIGGNGAGEYWNSPLAHALARSAYDAGKILGAICIAPVTLANAGLLVGRMATVWNDCRGQLRQKGAEVSTNMPVVRDGKIITASGPPAAEEFGKELVKAIIGF